jgi:hypothetical protein
MKFRNTPRTKRWTNIKFLARFIFENPGCTATEARKALCKSKNIPWLSNKEMRGQYTSYFSTGYIGYGWNNPLGKYWSRVKRADGKNGYVISLKGMRYL